MQFAFEGWWISDLSSFFVRKHINLYLSEAIEDSWIVVAHLHAAREVDINTNCFWKVPKIAL
jgi:hypothetical protein